MSGRARGLERAALCVALALLLWPLAWAVWLSFTPGETLTPPTGRWSLRWYRAFWADPRWTDALGNSLVVAAQAVALALVAGLGAALAVTRARCRGRAWLHRALLAPLFVPAVVLGMAQLPFVHRVGLWGSTAAVGLAHALWSLPVVYLILRAALEDLDPDLARAARGLGASRFQTVTWVVVPSIAPSLGLAAFAAFLLSLNEFVIALFLTTPATETLPRVIWPSLRYSLTPLVAAASALTLAATALGVLALAAGLHARQRRRPERE